MSKNPVSTALLELAPIIYLQVELVAEKIIVKWIFIIFDNLFATTVDSPESNIPVWRLFPCQFLWTSSFQKNININLAL